jgi:hypothetical protein
MNRDSKEWRSLWTLEMISRIAVHQSGVTARVARSPDDPRKDRISLENTANVDLSRWDLDELADEVMALWLEGNFEVLEGCITRCAGNPLFTQVTPHNLTRKRFASSYIR